MVIADERPKTWLIAFSQSYSQGGLIRLNPLPPFSCALALCAHRANTALLPKETSVIRPPNRVEYETKLTTPRSVEIDGSRPGSYWSRTFDSICARAHTVAGCEWGS